MNKPAYLYHGSRKKLFLLQPSQGVGRGVSDNECGVYAVSEREFAIPFAISYRPIGDDAAFSFETSTMPPRIVLKNADVTWHQKGYVYKVSAESFEQVSPGQWLSKVPVEPLEFEEIDPECYRGWVVCEP